MTKPTAMPPDASTVCNGFDAEYAHVHHEFNKMSLVQIAWHFWRVATQQANAMAAQPAAQPRLTDEQIREAVKSAGLDWHRGYVVDDECNRYEDLCRAIEAALQPKDAP